MLTILTRDTRDERFWHKGDESTMRSPGDHRYAHAPHGPSAPHDQRGDRCRAAPWARTGIGHAVAGIVGALSASERGDAQAVRHEHPGQAGGFPTAAPTPCRRRHPHVVADVTAARPVPRPARRRPRHELRGAAVALRVRRVRLRLLVPRTPSRRQRRRPPRRLGPAPPRRRGHLRRHLVERHDGQGPRVAVHRSDPHDPSRSATDSADPAR